MVASDHGHVDGGGHGGRSSVETTVYFIARGPVGSGQISGTTNLDFAPTALAHLLGSVDPAWGLDGRSSLP